MEQQQLLLTYLTRVSMSSASAIQASKWMGTASISSECGIAPRLPAIAWRLLGNRDHEDFCGIVCGDAFEESEGFVQTSAPSCHTLPSSS